MSQNIQLDPTIKDYVFVNGSPVKSDRVLEKCYYALMIPQGQYMYGKIGQGSYLYTLKNIKRTSSIEHSFVSYATDAINRQVIKTGDATKTQITNIEINRTGTSNQIDVIPSQVQVSTQFNFLPV